MTIVPGLYDGLSLHGQDLRGQSGIDRFRIDVPPLQRLTLDFKLPPIPDGAHVYNDNRLLGWIGPEDESVPARLYDTGAEGAWRPSVYDNSTNQTVTVSFSVLRDWHQPLGCTDYAMQVTVAPRPCDVLPDDTLEGPDDCAGATVLAPGAYDDLLVFNDLRAAGRDVDIYRIADVEPGGWFEVEVYSTLDGTFESHWPPAPVMEVFNDSGCPSYVIGDDRREFVANGTSQTRDYYVRVSTELDSGYEYYSLTLRAANCDDLAPDPFEPNDDCSAIVPIAPGVHALTLTDDDADWFEVVIPPGHTMRAEAVESAEGQLIEVSGAPAPACPPSGDSRYHIHQNTGTVAVDYRLKIASRVETCADYTLDLDVSPIWFTPEYDTQYEPNDDCSSATPSDYAGSWRELEFSLTPGDVDYYLVTVPPGETTQVSLTYGTTPSTGVRLTATPAGDCGGTGWHIELPSSMFHLPNPPETRLRNDSSVPRDFYLRLEPLGAPTGSTIVSLTLRPDPLPNDATYSRCSSPGVIEEHGWVYGTLDRGQSLFAATIVEPGRTLVASGSANSDGVYSPLDLLIHDGEADCALRGASLGSVRYTPPAAYDYDTASQYAFRGHYTNHGTTPRRVIVELAQDPGFGQRIQRAFLGLSKTPEPSHQVYCEGNFQTHYRVVCPCGNRSDAVRAEGCIHSAGRGARLDATGTNDLAADDRVVWAEGLPARVPILLLATRRVGGIVYNDVPRSFMDGRLCLGPGVHLLLTGVADGSGNWMPPAPLAGVVGDFVPGEDLRLQAWFRDPAGPCGSGSNLTNAIRVVWQ